MGAGLGAAADGLFAKEFVCRSLTTADASRAAAVELLCWAMDGLMGDACAKTCLSLGWRSAEAAAAAL